MARRIGGVCLWSWVAVAAVGQEEAPALDAESLPTWRAYLTPDEEAQKWRAIPWRSQFGDAVVQAQDPPRPVLLWAMNGHPLACT